MLAATRACCGGQGPEGTSMRLGESKIFRVSVLGLLSGLTLTTSAQAQWRDDRHGPVWRDERARFDHRAVVRGEDWHFDRGRGWRFEHPPASGHRTTCGGGPAGTW